MIPIELKVMRIRRGWTQVELSKRTGIDPAQISRLESGLVRKPERYRERIEKAFGFSDDE